MKTGFIGLGVMGYSMATNLHKAGFLTCVWNRSPSRAIAFSETTGTHVADSIADMAAECELIISCVSRDEDVLEVMNQLAGHVKKGTIVVDCSTTSRDTALKAAAIMHEEGAAFMDIPVTGGSEGARNGTLGMMAGGDAGLLDNIQAVLESMAALIVHIGPVGSGQACKAVNQSLCAGINQAVMESMAFGQALGLDMNKVIDVLLSGAAGNWFLDKRGRTMLEGTFEPGFKLALHHKDLVICNRMAMEMGLERTELMERTLAEYAILMEQGHGEEDISALFRLRSLNPV